jgi:gliding motility-associated-like protein
LNTGGFFTETVYLDSFGVFSPSVATAGDYAVFYTFIDGNGCSNTDSVNIAVLSSPSNLIELSPSEGCEKLVVNFKTEKTDSIVWTINSNQFINQNNVIDSFDNGIYQVSLEAVTAENCKIQLDTFITVFKKPEANFEFTPPSVYISNPQVYFQDLSKGSVIGWSWLLEEDVRTDDRNPIYNFSNAGNYDVILYIEDVNGCLDSISKNVIVLDEFIAFIPNGFTPNGDGLNDEFRIVGEGISNISVLIYNRWGEKIYDAPDFEAWDGTYKGSLVQGGSYVYLIEMIDLKGRIHYKKGTVTVLR